jgi:hypothetical protein
MITLLTFLIDSAIRKSAEAEIKSLRDLDPVSSIIFTKIFFAEKIPCYTNKRSGRRI